MHLLTHAHVAYNVMQDVCNLSARDKNLLLIGSILPDVPEVGIGSERRTHTECRKFLQFLKPSDRFLGLGALLHGEQPAGLDHFTHAGFYDVEKGYTKPITPGGYIASKHKFILSILLDYQNSLGPIYSNEAVHFVTEICFDHLTARDNPDVPSAVHHAIAATDAEHAIVDFSNFFGVEDGQVLRLGRILRSRNVKRYLHNFSSMHGTAQNFKRFLFLKGIRDRCTAQSFIRHIGHIARSSFGLLQHKLHDRALIDMFERCVGIVEKDYKPFLSNVQKSLKKMIIREFV